MFTVVSRETDRTICARIDANEMAEGQHRNEKPPVRHVIAPGGNQPRGVDAAGDLKMPRATNLLIARGELNRVKGGRLSFELRCTLAANCCAVIGQCTTEVVVHSESERQRVDVVIQPERLQSGRLVAVQEANHDGGVERIGE